MCPVRCVTYVSGRSNHLQTSRKLRRYECGDFCGELFQIQDNLPLRNPLTCSPLLTPFCIPQRSVFSRFLRE
jgi:hypothetical protein